MTRFLAALACVIGADAMDKEYPGYFHFKDLSMVNSQGSAPMTYNFYATPGDGAHDLGNQKTDADLALAKHLCDEYESCMWFKTATALAGPPGQAPLGGGTRTDATHPGHVHQEHHGHRRPRLLTPEQLSAPCCRRQTSSATRPPARGSCRPTR